MSDSEITQVVIATCFAVLVAWDVYATFFNDIPNSQDTESGIMRRLGSRVVGVAVGWGALGGHFWGPSHTLVPQPWGPIFLAATACVLTLMHWKLRKRFILPVWSALLYMVAGIPLGALLWAQ